MMLMTNSSLSSRFARNLWGCLSYRSVDRFNVGRRLQSAAVNEAIQFSGAEEVVDRVLNEILHGHWHRCNRTTMRKEILVRVGSTHADKRKEFAARMIVLDTPHDGRGSFLQTDFQVDVVGAKMTLVIAIKPSTVTQLAVLSKQQPMRDLPLVNFRFRSIDVVKFEQWL